MFTQIFFCYCAVMIVGTGILAVTLRNPVHSLLMVLILFFHMAGLYLTLQAEFLAAVQIIVYAGAILVLYLFVLFLVNVRDELRIDRFVSSAWLARILSAGLALCLIAILPMYTLGTKGEWPLSRVQALTHTKAIGQAMYTTYILPFEIAGLILLVAVIGGLVLAMKDSSTKNITNQERINS